METIVAPVSIEKSPEARGRSGLLTYKHKKIDLLLKEATYIYIHTKPQPMNLFFSQCKQSNLINLHHSLIDNHNNFFFGVILTSEKFYKLYILFKIPCQFQHHIIGSSQPRKCSSRLRAPRPISRRINHFNQLIIYTHSDSHFQVVAFSFNNPMKNSYLQESHKKCGSEISNCLYWKKRN